MRRNLLVFLLCLFPAILTSCTTTKFTKYQGSNVIEGKGGTVRTVDGIDFWANGTPNRKYIILGVIDDKRGSGLISRSSHDRNIVTKAKEYGGDAVILVEKSRYASSVNDYGNVSHKVLSKYYVVQYIE